MRLTPFNSLSTADVQAWRSLAENAADPNPAYEPDFVSAAVTADGADRPSLLIAERDGEWIGCLPVRGVGPFGLSNWRHSLSRLGTPLAHRATVDEFAAELVGGIGGRNRHRFLLLREATEGQTTTAIRAALARTRRSAAIFEKSVERAALRRGDGDPTARIKPKRRKEVEKKRARLAAELGGELEVLDRSTDPAAVKDFLRLEAAGWKGAGGTAMQTAGQGEAFRMLCASYAGAGRLQLLALQAGQRPVAMLCNLGMGNALFNLKVTYDEELRRFAPGIQLEVETMRIFAESRTEDVFDSCADPGNDLLNRLWPDRLRSTTMLIGPGGPVGRAAGDVVDRLVRRRRRTALRIDSPGKKTAGGSA
jgi:CelD/BcsL family acetyltransferase involved in cellulose biosynthesis